jgi:hypothetical protein
MPYAFVATRLDPSESGSTTSRSTTPPLHILTSLLSPPSPLAPDPSIRDRLLSVLPSLSSQYKQYKQCSLVTRTTTTGITLAVKPLKSSLKYSNTAKETSVPTQPHVPRDTVPSSSRKSVRFKDTGDGLESIRLFHATGRPSALFDPDSDTESDADADADTDDASSLSSLFQRLIRAGAAPVATPPAPLKVTQMPLIPSLYIPPNPNVYLESISPILIASARPPLLRGTVRVRNIAYEKRVAARFTIDDWTTVSEVLARYTGPAISGAHNHHGDGDDGKWDRFAFSISLEFYAPRRAGASSHSQHGFTLLLAVRFTTPGVGEWWDNNGGNDFRIVLAHTSAGSKVPGVSDRIPTAEFPRRPQAVTRFANAQATTAVACTRSLLRPYVTPAPTVVTN